MNRKDFKSAYDKITLSDECRAEMKNKLMAAMEQKNSSGEFEDDGLLHSTQEIKLASSPPLRSQRLHCSAPTRDLRVSFMQKSVKLLPSVTGPFSSVAIAAMPVAAANASSKF